MHAVEFICITLPTKFFFTNIYNATKTRFVTDHACMHDTEAVNKRAPARQNPKTHLFMPVK
jgi:hypothetical protein